MNVTVSSLTIYPVKSCAGIPLKQTTVGPRGFDSDRRWMIAKDGHFITQRTFPKMALIQIALDGLALTMKAPEMPLLKVPVNLSKENTCTVEIWNDLCPALDQGDEAARWLTRFLGFDVRLVYQPDDSFRPIGIKEKLPDDPVSFADRYPILVLSTASLEDLNLRLGHPIQMKRFRPNLVLDGCQPFDEDRWSHLTIGDVSIDIIRACIRCPIPNVDPETAESGTEPTATLASYRKTPKGIIFGQNAIARSYGVINVGDRVQVT